MRHAAGLTMREIADELALSPSAVAGALRRHDLRMADVVGYEEYVTRAGVAIRGAKGPPTPRPRRSPRDTVGSQREGDPPARSRSRESLSAVAHQAWNGCTPQDGALVLIRYRSGGEPGTDVHFRVGE